MAAEAELGRDQRRLRPHRAVLGLRLGLRTTATRAPDGWVLTRIKCWIGNATFSDITILWANSTEDGQENGFIVPRSTPGYMAAKIERKQATRIVQKADNTLENVLAPEAL